MTVAYNDFGLEAFTENAVSGVKTNKKGFRRSLCLVKTPARVIGLHAFAVFASAGIDFDLVALCDKNWHADLEAGGQLGGLEHFA